MALGLGLGLGLSNRGRSSGSLASAFYNRWADSNGGAVFSYEDDFVYIVDPVTPANNYNGSAITFFKTRGSYSGPIKPTRRASGLWLPNASGDLPYTWDASGNPLGYLPEESRTPRAAKSRRLDDASYWTASNVTTSATEGVDGVTGSATRITASSNNGTILGTSNTLASAAHRFDPFVRRVSGTGTLEYTIDGGSTWTVITGITSSFQRLGGSQTVANPRLGFRIQSSGDSFDIDYANGETGAFATSPIESGTSPTARTADNASVATSALPFNASAGTLYSKGIAYGMGFQFACLDNGTNSNSIRYERDSTARLVWTLRNGGVSSGTISSPTEGDATVELKAAYALATNDFKAYSFGTARFTNTTVAMPSLNTLRIGRYSGGTIAAGALKTVAYFPRRIVNADLATMTT